MQNKRYEDNKQMYSNRDTDADGIPDRIDAQYSYPAAEIAKQAHEQDKQRANQASRNQNHRQPIQKQQIKPMSK